MQRCSESEHGEHICGLSAGHGTEHVCGLASEWTGLLCEFTWSENENENKNEAKTPTEGDQHEL